MNSLHGEGGFLHVYTCSISTWGKPSALTPLYTLYVAIIMWLVCWTIIIYTLMIMVPNYCSGMDLGLCELSPLPCANYLKRWLCVNYDNNNIIGLVSLIYILGLGITEWLRPHSGCQLFWIIYMKKVKSNISMCGVHCTMCKTHPDLVHLFVPALYIPLCNLKNLYTCVIIIMAGLVKLCSTYDVYMYHYLAFIFTTHHVSGENYNIHKLSQNRLRHHNYRNFNR